MAKRDDESGRGLSELVRSFAQPPRDAWLAVLGGYSLSQKTLRNVWGRLVTEGKEVEGKITSRIRTGWTWWRPASKKIEGASRESGL